MKHCHVVGMATVKALIADLSDESLRSIRWGEPDIYSLSLVTT